MSTSVEEKEVLPLGLKQSDPGSFAASHLWSFSVSVNS